MNDHSLVQQVMDQLHDELALYRDILTRTDEEIRRLRAGADVAEIEPSLEAKNTILDQVPASLTRRRDLLVEWEAASSRIPAANVTVAREVQQEAMSTMKLALERMDELSSLVATAVTKSRGTEENFARQRQASQAYQRLATPDPRFIDRKR